MDEIEPWSPSFQLSLLFPALITRLLVVVVFSLEGPNHETLHEI